MRCCRWVYVRLLLDSCSLHKMPGKPPYWSWNSMAVNPLSLRRAGLNILSLAIWPCTSDMHRLICSANWDNSCKSSLLLGSSPSVSSSYDLRIPAMIFSVWRLITVLWYLPSLSNPRKCLLPPEINISSVFMAQSLAGPLLESLLRGLGLLRALKMEFMVVLWNGSWRTVVIITRLALRRLKLDRTTTSE